MEILDITSIREELDSCIRAHLMDKKSLSDENFVSKVLSFEKQLICAYKESYIY